MEGTYWITFDGKLVYFDAEGEKHIVDADMETRARIYADKGCGGI